MTEISVICKNKLKKVTETLRHFFVAKGIDRYFVRMVTDVYGADGVMQQSLVRCI